MAYSEDFAHILNGKYGMAAERELPMKNILMTVKTLEMFMTQQL